MEPSRIRSNASTWMRTACPRLHELQLYFLEVKKEKNRKQRKRLPLLSSKLFTRPEPQGEFCAPETLVVQSCPAEPNSRQALERPARNHLVESTSEPQYGSVRRSGRSSGASLESASSAGSW